MVNKMTRVERLFFLICRELTINKQVFEMPVLISSCFFLVELNATCLNFFKRVVGGVDTFKMQTFIYFESIIDREMSAEK